MPVLVHRQGGRASALAVLPFAMFPLAAFAAPDRLVPNVDAASSERVAVAPAQEASTVAFETIYVRGLQPTSLPTRLPTTTEGITGVQIRERINATDAEDALKYLPSLLVRKRYIGDYDHAVLATRASGTGNSARSLVYADGVLLSNLLGNGASFTPRWGLVSPEEIERVDVLYGPFSAAYSGNSVGAVVDYVTRMPREFEAHAKLGYSFENFDLFRTHGGFAATSASASIGNRWGGLSAWLSLNRLDSKAHPIGFATLPLSSAGVGPGTPVVGAIAGRNPRNQDWYLIGATGQTDTRQGLAKLKLGYDFGAHLRLSYLMAFWDNDGFRDADTYLGTAAGEPVYSGNVQIDGHAFTIAPTAISLQRARLGHRMQALSLRAHGNPRLDYSLSLSRYDYVGDELRSPTVALPLAADGGAGRIADGSGTGWRTGSASLSWIASERQLLEFGIQDDHYTLDTLVSSTPDWISGAPIARVSAFAGKTRLSSVYAQDSLTISSRWTVVAGARWERWKAEDGLLGNATRDFAFPSRSEASISPKAALQFSAEAGWSIKASIGRAVRFPTVSELYQGTISVDAIVNNDPDLKPERSVTSELSWLGDAGPMRLRATIFHEQTREALYSQTNATVTPNITSIQNVGAIRTNGLELAGDASGLWNDRLDLTASLTFADSIIRENDNLPTSVGRWQPRVPRWRSNLVVTYRPAEQWTLTAGVRYSGEQYNTLDNSDTNSHAYTGTSPFLVTDLRAVYRPTTRWSAALGVDNVGNRTYWNFHPYNQRTWNLELRYDL